MSYNSKNKIRGKLSNKLFNSFFLKDYVAGIQLHIISDNTFKAFGIVCILDNLFGHLDNTFTNGDVVVVIKLKDI